MAAVEDISLVPTPPLTLLAGGGSFDIALIGALSLAPSDSGLLSAKQVALNAVDVTFLAAPKAIDPASLNDALRPRNWRLLAYDPHDATERLVQRVDAQDALTLRVFTDGPLTTQATYLIELAPVVIDAVTLLPLLCRCVFFVTFRASRRVREVEALPQDLANPFMPRDAPVPGAPLSTWQIDPTGDIGRDSGLTNLRKRVFRRATTRRDSFPHLPGYGFLPALKGPITADALKQIERDGTAQLLSEPDVAAARVTASALVPGVVTFKIEVSPLIGQAITMIVPVEVQF